MLSLRNVAWIRYHVRGKTKVRTYYIHVHMFVVFDLTILVVLKLFSGALEHDVSQHSLESCIGYFADVVSSCEQRDFAAWGVEVGIVPSTLCSYSEPFAFRY